MAVTIHAICLKCGAGKAGALAQCRRCGFHPQETDDKAKSVLLSDRCAGIPVLKKFAEKIASGYPVKFDEADVHKWANVIDSIPKPLKRYGGLTVRNWTVLGIGLGAGVAFGFCYFSWVQLR